MKHKIDFNKLSVHGAPKKSPGFLLWQISTSWRNSIEAVLREDRLTHPQFVILAILGWLTRNGELVTQAVVGREARLDPNTTSQILVGLEKKKFIKRVVSTDSRAKHPLLTSSGKKILSKALPNVEKADASFFNSLSKGEMDILLKLFQKLVIE